MTTFSDTKYAERLQDPVVQSLSYLAKHVIYVDGDPLKGLRRDTVLIDAEGNLRKDIAHVVNITADVSKYTKSFAGLTGVAKPEIILGSHLVTMATDPHKGDWILPSLLKQADIDNRAINTHAYLGAFNQKPMIGLSKLEGEATKWFAKQRAVEFNPTRMGGG